MRRRHSHGSATAAVASAVAALLVSTTAGAAEPSPTTTEAPTTSVAPPTTVAQPPAPTTSKPRSTTTTVPSTSTSVAPTTTLGTAGPGDGPVGGYAATPAPLIPSASSDPLFHAALTVDDDLRALSLANAQYRRSSVAAHRADAKAKATGRVAAQVDDIDRRAERRLTESRSILRAAALHAYAGYGADQVGVSTPEVSQSQTVLPYRTYVRVTIADATRHVGHAQSDHDGAHTRALAARHRDQLARDASARAEQARKSAKKAVDDAKKKLARDRKTLADQIANMPDLAPGTLDRLPDATKLPPGATGVQSPVGTIVVPAKADPRSVVALQFIVAQLGKPYVWGATGPNSYDCSGLMLRAFQAAGVTSMPRVSQAQQVWATPVDVKDIQPGDLVFFGRPAYHVGVYIGGGLMIDAPYTGSHVRVDRVWSSVSSYGRAIWSSPPPA